MCVCLCYVSAFVLWQILSEVRQVHEKMLPYAKGHHKYGSQSKRRRGEGGSSEKRERRREERWLKEAWDSGGEKKQREAACVCTLSLFPITFPWLLALVG